MFYKIRCITISQLTKRITLGGNLHMALWTDQPQLNNIRLGTDIDKVYCAKIWRHQTLPFKNRHSINSNDPWTANVADRGKKFVFLPWKETGVLSSKDAPTCISTENVHFCKEVCWHLVSYFNGISLTKNMSLDGNWCLCSASISPWPHKPNIEPNKVKSL